MNDRVDPKPVDAEFSHRMGELGQRAESSPMYSQARRDAFRAMGDLWAEYGWIELAQQMYDVADAQYSR